MGLESLESGFLGAFCDTIVNPSQPKTQYIAMAYFYNQHLDALYSQWRSLHSTHYAQLTPNSIEQTR